jgi:thioredoxin-related protein
LGKGTEAIYGNATLFQVQNKYFKLGIFKLGLIDNYLYNDSTTENSVFAVYYVNDLKKQGSFSLNYNPSNSSKVISCHYLYLEGELFNIKYIDSVHIDISKAQKNINISELEYTEVLDCLYHISYLDFKLIDEAKNKVSINNYFKKNKLNIIYCTMKGCAPCEKMKKGMIELSHDKNINVIFVSMSDDLYDETYKDAKNKLYSSGFEIKITRNGFPDFYFFDGQGNLIIPDFSSEKLQKLKFPEQLKVYAADHH